MSNHEVLVRNGPDKAALQSAVNNKHEHQHVSFDTDEGLIEGHLDAMQVLGGNAVGVVIRGYVTSGPLSGRSFIGTYDADIHKGSLRLGTAP